jgi:hypothetical protein
MQNITYECPPGLKIQSDHIVASPKAEEKWYGIIARYTTKFGPAQKELRVLVRHGFHVRMQAMPDADAKTLLTTFTVRTTDPSRPLAYSVATDPMFPEITLPAGNIGETNSEGAKVLDKTSTARVSVNRSTVSIPLSSFTKLKRPLQFFANVSMSGSIHKVGLLRVGITPILPAAPEIDGDIGETTGLPSFILNDTSELVPGEFPAPYKGNADASARVCAAWAPEGLYVAADITDDFPMMNMQQPGPDIFRGDGIEVYFRPGGSGGHHYSSRENGFYHFAISTGQAGRNAVVSDFQTTVPGSSVAVRPTRSGCHLEALIPYASLGNYKPAAGDINAWDLELNDGDSYSDRAGKKSLMWNGDGKNWLLSEKWGLAVIPSND